MVGDWPGLSIPGRTRRRGSVNPMYGCGEGHIAEGWLDGQDASSSPPDLEFEVDRDSREEQCVRRN